MEWSFESSGPVEAEISVPAGSVEIEQGAEDRVAVVLEPMRGIGSHRAEELLAESDVAFDSGKLRVHVPERHFRQVDVRCVVRIPEHSPVVTKTASADVASRVVLASYDGTSASGDIALSSVDRGVVVKTASGNLTCDEVGGSLRVKSASGDVSVRHAGGEVDVGVASGDVDLGDAAASVKVRSASGDVRIGKAASGRVRVETASGDVTIGVAPGAGAYLDVTSVSGDVTSELPFESEGADAATLELLCRTVSGDVSVEAAE
jgi:DUF4097 and DUF4098 domain-containing protein YvlB